MQPIGITGQWTLNSIFLFSMISHGQSTLSCGIAANWKEYNAQGKMVKELLVYFIIIFSLQLMLKKKLNSFYQFLLIEFAECQFVRGTFFSFPTHPHTQTVSSFFFLYFSFFHNH